MSLAATSIRRPVLTIVLSLGITLFGVIAFTFLGVREYPAVDPPVITVSTSYVGANADVIEAQITEPLEASLNGVAGIRSLVSSSSEGRSNIRVEFQLGTDLEAAANDVRDRVSRAMRSLPPDADPPIVSKSDADASPIVSISVMSDKRDQLELSGIANDIIKERLQTIPGVSEVRIWGEKRYSMRLWIVPSKLAAYGLTPRDVLTALAAENVELPTGRIEGYKTELTVRTMGRLSNPDEFGNLIIKEIGGNVVRFRDVGYVELGPENQRTIFRRDGVPMVGVAITPQPGANHVAIADEFYKRVEQIKKDLPPDITIATGFDVTKYIRRSVSEVQETLLIAFGLVVLVIFLFLRDWRTTIIPVVAIPISIIGAFFVMYLANFSINVLTLLGLVLAIGIVVDDAIVVLENIYSKVERGMASYEAGFKGSQEIYLAIISTTVALVIIFFPVVFLGGLTGSLFREFGIVIAGSVIISAFVSLSLTPMMSTRVLSFKKGHSWFWHKTEPFFAGLVDRYRATLHRFLQHRWLGFAIMAVALVMIFVFGSVLRSELAPLEDRSRLQVSSTAPEGVSFEYMDAYMQRLSSTVAENVPEREAIMAMTAPGFGTGSVNSGNITVVLKDKEFRERSQQEIASSLSRIVRNYSEARTFVTQDQTISVGMRRGGLPVQYVVQAANIDKLKQVIPKFMEEASKHPAFTIVDVNLKFNKPELRVSINREKARALGVSVIDIAQTIQLALSGQRFGYFVMNGKQYQVIGQLTRENRDDPVDLKSLFVRNREGKLIQLDNLVSLSEDSRPPQLYRFNRYSAATFSAGLAPGYTLGDGIKAMDEIASKVLDDSYSTTLDGPSRDFVESSSSLLFAFVLALILIYLVLAAQFESFIDPFVILLTVPLALAGALFALWYFDQTLNIFSQIGIIMLIGLVTKNGILIVEFANQRKAAGLSVREAVQEAAAARLRPILMTSLSTMCGFMPVALALGAGAESRVSMGIAVIGGLVFSSVLTLYVIPSMYSFFSRKKVTEPVTSVEATQEEFEPGPPVVVGGNGGSEVVTNNSMRASQ
ncbi:MAG TPA: efflux RND transporter permease subunit [Bacteroidota bacterium]|nr:efflux RND transporter permease subunit [Bacteroidota bacterium]